DDPPALERAVAADRVRLRERLQGLLSRPEIREALFVASPDLDDALKHWYDAPESERGARAERALVRYVSRMATRPTPFGLFAATSIGALGEETRLVMEGRPHYARHTRLDMDYLFALTGALATDPALRDSLRYAPNSSLYRAAGRLRYVEARLNGNLRTYHLVAVDDPPRLRAALDLAAGGIGAPALAAALATPDLAPQRLARFVNSLIEHQLLLPELAPYVTGPEALHPLIDQLRAQPETAAAARLLESTRDELAKIDRARLGGDPERYHAIAASLEDLPAKPEVQRLFQIDLEKPAPDATLGGEVLEEMRRGLRLLHRIVRQPDETALTRFAAAFEARYEQ